MRHAPTHREYQRRFARGFLAALRDVSDGAAMPDTIATQQHKDRAYLDGYVIGRLHARKCQKRTSSSARTARRRVQ
jgi:hypothetical protein